MITFDPKDPFPLLEYGSYSYEDAKAHAVLVDGWLGYRCEEVEALVNRNEGYAPDKNDHGFHTEYWRGLPLQVMQTPYVEIRTLISQLMPTAGATIVDLGCAYGRMAHVIGRHHPELRFVGYEFILERVVEARRTLGPLEYQNAEIEVADLSAKDFAPISADIYLLYDFGSRHAIEKTLIDLRNIAGQRAITVVGRGRNSRQIIERGHPWLAEVIAPKHFAGYSIYRTQEE